MDKKILLCVFVALFAGSNGVQPSNYDISLSLSRNGLGGRSNNNGGGYGGYNPGYPSGGYPGYYPGGGGSYPGYNHGPPGPPGAHHGCPLCDSSVYSYCSYKEAHDSCCCGQSYNQYQCRKSSCNFLYANSCEEYDLISSCCCVDLHKNAMEPAVA